LKKVIRKKDDQLLPLTGEAVEEVQKAAHSFSQILPHWYIKPSPSHETSSNPLPPVLVLD